MTILGENTGKKLGLTSGHPAVCSTRPGQCLEGSIDHSSFSPIP
jgi:hypothetical protein